jgi:Domain of unknown function (DUF4262)
MCDMCDAGVGDDPILIQQWRDRQEARLGEQIRARGWALQGVLGEDDVEQPGFVYTIGMSGFDHPEFVVFGLEPGHAMQVLGYLCELVRAGVVPRDGDTVTTPYLQYPARLFAVPNPEQVLLVAQAGYRMPGADPVPALQVVYADCCGTFPWEPGYAHPRWRQPMPGTFVA